MAVTAQNPVISYTASGSNTVFVYPYRILIATDISVYIDSVLITTGYVVGGVGNPAGGSVTFDSPPAGGSTVKLLRSIPRTRSTHYIEGGALPAAVLDDDFDRVVLMLQDVRADSASLVEFDAVISAVNANAAAAAVSATSASSDALIASAAALSAEIDAATATSKALEAIDAADMSAASASSASTSASTASASASTASSAATAAATSEMAAAASAATAAGHSSSASTSASASASSATSASGSASSASSSATSAATSAAAAAISAASVVGVPSGAVFYFASTSAPSGFLKADGSVLSRSTYVSLWTFANSSGNIATEGVQAKGQFSYGDGSTTFRIPDLRGEFIRNLDDGKGIDIGRAIGSAQANQNKTHSHTTSVSSNGGHDHNSTASAGSADGQTLSNSAGSSYPLPWGSSGGSPAVRTSSDGSHVHTVTVNADGGTEARPGNVALLACIKT